MLADFVERWRTARADAAQQALGGQDDVVEQVVAGETEKSWPFRAYLLWLTFPPITLLFLDQPFALVVGYGVLGAFFMPFLALTLLWLLNSKRTPQEWRNGLLSNAMLAAAGLLFVVLCVQQIRELLP